MTREEFERADEIIDELDRISDLEEEFLKVDSFLDVEIRISKNKGYYFNNKTVLGRSILKSIEETVNNYVKNIKDEFEKL